MRCLGRLCRACSFGTSAARELHITVGKQAAIRGPAASSSNRRPLRSRQQRKGAPGVHTRRASRQRRPRSSGGAWHRPQSLGWLWAAVASGPGRPAAPCGSRCGRRPRDQPSRALASQIMPQRHASHALQVHMSPLGSGLTVEDTVDLYCGEGEQILQWIGYASCSRLAYKRGAGAAAVSEPTSAAYTARCAQQSALAAGAPSPAGHVLQELRRAPQALSKRCSAATLPPSRPPNCSKCTAVSHTALTLTACCRPAACATHQARCTGGTCPRRSTTGTASRWTWTSW